VRLKVISFEGEFANKDASLHKGKKLAYLVRNEGGLKELAQS
jgi:hypothetical protein